MIVLELNNKDAELFKAFRKYQDDFDIMFENGVFDFSGGQAIIHRDDKSQIRKIEIKRIAYKS